MRFPSSAIAASRVTPRSSATRSMIDHAGLVQRDRERIGGARDLRRDGRMEHPLGEDRALPRDAGLDVVVLDRGDEPDVGIVEEGLKVRPADGLADLAVCARRSR